MIELTDVRKSYGATKALDGLSAVNALFGLAILALVSAF